MKNNPVGMKIGYLLITFQWLLHFTKLYLNENERRYFSPGYLISASQEEETNGVDREVSLRYLYSTLNLFQGYIKRHLQIQKYLLKRNNG